MKMIRIRHTEFSDVDAVLAVFDVARTFMRACGNMEQWTNGYPSRQTVCDDIRRGAGYVVECDGELAGTFAFVEGADPNYGVIDGRWPDERPYGTIHRLASSGRMRGIADLCLEFCMTRGVNIRIDTHADNAPMLAWIARSGFEYCGVVWMADGTPRRAFQKSVR